MYLVKYDDVYFLMKENKDELLNIGDVIYINGVISNATQYHVFNKNKLNFMVCKASSLNTLKLPLINGEKVDQYLSDNKSILFTYADMMNIINFTEILVSDTNEAALSDLKTYAKLLKNKIISNIVIDMGDIFEYNQQDEAHPYGYYKFKQLSNEQESNYSTN